MMPAKTRTQAGGCRVWHDLRPVPGVEFPNCRRGGGHLSRGSRQLRRWAKLWGLKPTWSPPPLLTPNSLGRGQGGRGVGGGFLRTSWSMVVGSWASVSQPGRSRRLPHEPSDCPHPHPPSLPPTRLRTPFPQGQERGPGAHTGVSEPLAQRFGKSGSVLGARLLPLSQLGTWGRSESGTQSPGFWKDWTGGLGEGWGPYRQWTPCWSLWETTLPGAVCPQPGCPQPGQSRSDGRS